jgi:hypothetical protein
MKKIDRHCMPKSTAKSLAYTFISTTNTGAGANSPNLLGGTHS